MATQPPIKAYYTFEKYLQFEREALERHEYHDGEILQMSGGTENHSLISGRVITSLNNALDKTDKNCRIANSDLKVFIESVNHGVYPDVMMYYGAADYCKEDNTVITNPLLVVEVLSKSTKSYDKGLKFEKYRTLGSFREYMLVWQTLPKVQTWYKMEENVWRISSAFGLDKSIYLFTLEQSIELKDIYRRVNSLGDKDNFEAY